MRTRTLSLRLILPAGLVVLVGVLATLEYRWLGQVSEADRDRRRASLQQRAEEFADDFDRSLAPIYSMLQADSTAVQRGEFDSFARHYEYWRSNARDPEMLRGVYLLDVAPEHPRIREYHADTRTFVDTTWPDALVTLRTRRPGQTTGGAAAVVLQPREPMVASIPAVVVNLTSVGPVQTLQAANIFAMRETSGFLVGYLNRDYLQTSVLPALAARYFPERDADLYRLAIVDVNDRTHPILARGLAPGASIDLKQADANVPLFSLRPELTTPILTRSTLTNNATFSAMGVSRGGAAAGGRGGAGAGGGAGGRMMASPSVPAAGGAATPPARVAPSSSFRITADTAAVRAAAEGLKTSSVQGVQIVVQAGPGDTTNVLRWSSRGAAWQLLLQHSSGSLDAAVNQARRRNLWLSFGILGVLMAAVGLIVINAQRSERLAAQQMDFVATVSHELRTPLAVIRAAAQNLSAGVVLDHVQARKYGELIDAEGRRLTDMVEQVLEYAGLSGGRRPIMARPVDMGDVVKDALASCEAFLPSDQFDVVIDVARDLPAVSADEGAIRRALQNLITNALKYGADGRWLGITVSHDQVRGRDEVQATVSDHGRGIEPDDLPHIFEAFYRGRRAVDEQIHGNGLGLSLVQRIAEAHGGRVTVKSAPGNGTSFTLHLPAIKPGNAAHTEDVMSSSTLRRETS